MDPKFRIYFEGLPDDAIRSAEKVVTSLNKANDAQKRYSRERQQLARTERQERFRELSQEEQYQRLLQRREQLERRLAQARARGQGSRVDALELLLARNRGQLRGIQPSAAPTVAPSRGILGRIGGALMGRAEAVGASGSLGNLLGGAGLSGGAMAGLAAVGVIGVYLKKIVGAMVDAVKDSLRFADEMDDLADQTGLTLKDVIRVRAASGAVGLKANKAFSGISNIANVRSQALAGDPQAMALFGRYGVTQKMLGSDASDLAIGSQIQKSLGAGGMTPNDAGPLRNLLGRRPEQIVAFLKAFNDLGGSISTATENTVESLAKINTKIEQAGNAWTILKVKFTGYLMSFYEEHLDTIKKAEKMLVPFLQRVAPKQTAAVIESMKESGLLKTEGKDSKAAEDEKRTADPAPFSAQNKAGLSAALRAQAIQRFQQTDSLSRIGIFTGAAGIAQAGLAKAQFEKLAEMVRVQIETRNLMKVRL